MTTEIICPVSGESPKEERINHLTHLAGLLLSLIGFALLVYYASLSGDFLQIVSCSIYGTTLFLLYAASTFYHGCETIHRKHVLKIVDHVCIYLLIAGSYTPFSLGPLRDSGGWNLLFVVWGISCIGIVLKIISINQFRILSVFAYILLGWLIVFSFPQLFEELSTNAVIFLISGGLIYSLGTLFYLWDSLPFNHAIWHVFVLGGSMCHYCSVLDMIRQPL